MIFFSTGCSPHGHCERMGMIREGQYQGLITDSEYAEDLQPRISTGKKAASDGTA